MSSHFLQPLFERQALARLLRLLLQGYLLLLPTRLASVIRATRYPGNLGCFCFQAHVVEDPSVRDTSFVMCDWYASKLLPLRLLEVIAIGHLVILNTPTGLGRKLSIRDILGHIVSMVRGALKVLALPLYPGDNRVAYAGRALVEVDMVDVAVYQNTVVLSYVTWGRSAFCFAMYVDRVLVGLLL